MLLNKVVTYVGYDRRAAREARGVQNGAGRNGDRRIKHLDVQHIT